MQAQPFYQTRSEGAIPLILQNEALFKDNEAGLSEYDNEALRAQQFQGQLGEIAVTLTPQGKTDKVYLGMGDQDDVEAILYAVTRLAPGAYKPQSPLSEAAEVAWSVAQYRFDMYKKDLPSPRVLVVRDQGLSDTLAEVNAIFLVRDLINRPANALTPEALAAETERLANKYDAHFEQWVGDALLEANFPAIHAVGRAAGSAPRLLALTWGHADHPRVTLVGKGVCFDSGGLDLKPASNMRIMKKDMGGAAQVLGLAQWLMEKRLPIRLRVLIPAVENAVGKDAYRPGDVLTMRNGLHVEIDNTDAEGRLVLADALTLACEENPELLIDYATLTGAARVAVGTDISALFSNDDALADAVVQSGLARRDPVWRLPLYAGYKSLLKSSIADLVNSSPSAYAGAITAGLFLQYFVKDACPWLHFDIMAWNDTSKPGKPEGGEAMGIKAVAHYLFDRFS